METYTGFIEIYRDPGDMRVEFDRFVSTVNNEMSTKSKALVDKTGEMLPVLPWSKEFEKRYFSAP